MLGGGSEEGGGNIVLLVLFLWTASCVSQDGNRLVYLDAYSDLNYPSTDFPKLVTPQWIGETGIQAAVIIAGDDLTPQNLDRYERFLRPAMARLQQIDGRAPISLFATS